MEVVALQGACNFGKLGVFLCYLRPTRNITIFFLTILQNCADTNTICLPQGGIHGLQIIGVPQNYEDLPLTNCIAGHIIIIINYISYTNFKKYIFELPKVHKAKPCSKFS